MSLRTMCMLHVDPFKNTHLCWMYVCEGKYMPLMHVKFRELLGVCSFLLAWVSGSNIGFQAYMTSALTH